jgi:hypothetical protein
MDIRARLRDVTLFLLACSLLSGCTVCIWADDWWPVSRKGYTEIESALMDDRGNLYVHILRDHADAQTWTVDVTLPRFPEPQPRLVDQVPASANRRVCVVTYQLASFPHGGEWPGGLADPSELVVALQDFRTSFRIAVADHRRNVWIPYMLPDPSIAWATPNAVAHVLVTPFTVILDVVLSPVWVIGGALFAIGVIPGH